MSTEERLHASKLLFWDAIAHLKKKKKNWFIKEVTDNYGTSHSFI